MVGLGFVMKTAILITGVTGMLGFEVMCRAWREGLWVKVLARRGEFEAGSERLRALALAVGMGKGEVERLVEGVEVFEGDLTRERLGLEEKVWNEMVEGVGEVFHCAGEVNFVRECGVDFWGVNVEGTKRVWEVLKGREGVFYHVSTAYVSGVKEGVVKEGWPVEFRASNGYEASKYEAERWLREQVHAVGEGVGPKLVVMRPSILMGKWKDGATLCFKNIYQVLKVLHGIARVTCRKGEVLDRLRVRGDGEVTLNLVPLDWVVEGMWRVRASGKSAWGETFHFCHPQALRMAQLTSILRDIFGLPLETGLEEGEGSELEQAVSVAMEPYRGYLAGEPVFDQAVLNRVVPEYLRGCRPLDTGYFRRVVSFAADRRWGGKLKWNRGGGSAGYARRYFNHFLSRRLGMRLLEGVRHLNGVFGVKLEEGTLYGVEIKEGRLRDIFDGLAREVQCVYEMNGETFQRIGEGRCSPHQAFFERKVEIEGDMEVGLRVATVLADFFKQFPYIEEGI